MKENRPRKCCPACLSVSIETRIRAKKYWCRRCGALFSIPGIKFHLGGCLKLVPALNRFTEYKRCWYRETAEIRKQKSKEYYLKNKEKIKERNKAYYLKNKEQINARSKAYYYAHKKGYADELITCQPETFTML